MSLHAAARDGKMTKCRLLLAVSTKAVRAQDSDGYTPLHHATQKGHIKVCRLLLDKQAPLEVKENRGATPLHYAAFCDRVEIARMLLEKGANVEAQENNGWTPLHIAAQNGHFSMCSLLLRKGASLDARTNTGYTCLHFAARNGHLDTCRVLIEADATLLESQDNLGMTPLQVAVENGHLDTCRALIVKAGCVETSTDHQGRTALHIASQNAHLEICRLLVQKGASVLSRNHDGKTAAQLATVSDIKQFLEEAETEAKAQTFFQANPEASRANLGVVVVKGNEYFFDQQTSVLDGRNSVFKDVSSRMSGKVFCLKLYDDAVKGHGNRELDFLLSVQQVNAIEAKRFVVQAVDFDENVVMNKQQTNKSALVMELGKENLKEAIQSALSSGDSSHDQTVPIMKKVAECVEFVHRHGFVYGDLKLENVVNFGSSFPNFKLIDFENCCRINQPMPTDFTAEYCPPEMAQYTMAKNRSHQSPPALLADVAFDSWCFGVLWMKYTLRGDPLLEFQYASPDEILAKLVDPTFSFDNTLRRLSLSKPVETLVRKCLSRNPTQRPTFKQILKDNVLRGYATTMHDLTEQGKSMKEVQSLIQAQTKLIWQVDQITLPILWALVPFEDTNPSSQWSLSKLVYKELELKMICDGAFDESNDTLCCACPEKYRIKVQYSNEFVQKCLPVLNAVSMFVKLASVGSTLLGLPIPGLGNVVEKLTAVVPGGQLMSMMQEVLEQVVDDDGTIKGLNTSVDDLVDAVSTAQEFDEEMRQHQLHSVEVMKSHIRSSFEDAERQQAMREVLEMAAPGKDWQKDVIIGGLQRVRVVRGPDQGAVHWVCANHARCAQYQEVNGKALAA